MDRRTFIRLSGFGAAISIAPYLHSCSKSKWVRTLALPQTLGQFCDKEELLEVGKTYCEIFSAEADVSVLEDLIIGDHQPQSPESLTAFIDQKIAEDFASNKIAITRGWVLSKTEARQAALYSLVNA